MPLATIVRKMAARFSSPDNALIIQVMNAFQQRGETSAAISAIRHPLRTGPISFRARLCSICTLKAARSQAAGLALGD